MTTIDYEALFRSSPYPYLVMDTELTVIDANDAYLRSTGAKAEAIIGKYVFDAFPENPDDPDSTSVADVRNSLQKAIATGLPDTTAFLRYSVPKTRGENPDFVEKYWSTTSTPIVDKEGKITVVVQHPIDVTDLYNFNKTSQKASVESKIKAAESADNFNRAQMHEAMLRILNDERGHMRSLFNQAPGFVAVLTGPNHVFEMVNEAYYQLVGHRDIIGKTVWQALPEVKGQGYDELLDGVYNTGKAWVGKSAQFAVQRQPNAPLETRYVDLLYQPIFDADGKVSGIFAQGHDVTEAYESQVAYRETEERLREGMMAAKMVVWDCNLDDKTTKFSENTAAVLGCSPTNIDELLALLHEKDRLIAQSSIDYAIAQKSEFSGTFRINSCINSEKNSGNNQLDHGNHNWIDIRGRVRKDSERKDSEKDSYSLRGVALDVTDRMQATENLRNADRQKDEFLAMLAHELRNPLAPISAAAEILSLAPPDETLLRRTADIIKRQITHLVGLVDDLLDVSRVTTGLITTEMASVNLKEVIGEAIEQCSPAINARQHKINLEVPTEDVLIRGDHKRMVQVFTNILINAAKFTPNGGNITTNLTVTEDLATINIIDDGNGIAPDLLPRIFDLFAQGKRTVDRAQGGLGIGLALVKSLVEIHGGTVKAFSTPGTKGSRFEIQLPRLHGDLAAKTTQEPTVGQKLRILIVDDNADAANTLADVLRSKGHSTDVEYAAAAAIERAVATVHDVFLLDIGLPEMDGNALVRYLKAQPATADALMIAVTGYGAEQNKRDAFSAGFDDYFVKPLDIDALLQRLNRHILP